MHYKKDPQDSLKVSTQNFRIRGVTHAQCQALAIRRYYLASNTAVYYHDVVHRMYNLDWQTARDLGRGMML